MLPPRRPNLPGVPPRRPVRPRGKGSSRAAPACAAVLIAAAALAVALAAVRLGSGPPGSAAAPGGADLETSGAPVLRVPDTAPAGRDGPAAAFTGNGSAQDVIGRVKRSVVLIIALGSGGASSGTGFVLDGTRVATCSHVVAGARRLIVFTGDGRRLDPEVAAADPVSDLAVLRCGPGLPPPLSLGDSDAARDGDEIAVTGFPVFGKFDELGFRPAPSTTRGTLSARREREVRGRVVDVLQIDAAINPGNSGGPVYSVRDGSVLGVASSKLVQEQGIGFAVSAGALRRLLER